MSNIMLINYSSSAHRAVLVNLLQLIQFLGFFLTEEVFSIASEFPLKKIKKFQDLPGVSPVNNIKKFTIG